MKILAIEQEVTDRSPDDFAPYLQEEVSHAWQLYTQGIIRELYFHQESHTAVIIMECSSADEAVTILGKLPLVRAGLIRFEVIPLVPYDGFTGLFGGPGSEPPPQASTDETN
ncbi:MAG: superoxide dismutase [Chloroflexi bacterium]|nr:superoxide dismutase [Chloroflexota bacterium]